MTAISGGFGQKVSWGSDANGGKSYIKLNSADTVSGEIDDALKNPLFCKAHTIVKREDVPVEEFEAAKQSNIFYADLEIGGSDPGQVAKLADVINQVITQMENYLDDNGKIAGVHGPKTIVTGNDARLTAAINAALSMDMLQGTPNVAFKRATHQSTPYLNMIAQCKNGRGFFIVDKSYNASNHGPEFTERVPFTLTVNNLTRPDGVSYDGRQRFDINVASWRGIAYCYIGTPAGASGNWDDVSKYTKLDVVDTIVKPVSIVGKVDTSA